MKVKWFSKDDISKNLDNRGKKGYFFKGRKVFLLKSNKNNKVAVVYLNLFERLVRFLAKLFTKKEVFLQKRLKDKSLTVFFPKKKSKNPSNKPILKIKTKKTHILEYWQANKKAGCEGPVSESKVKDYFKKLNQRAPDGITFSEKYLAEDEEEKNPANYLSGGFCTVSSLKFLTAALKEGEITKRHLKKAFKNFDHTQDPKKAKKYRAIQRALNTIVVTKEKGPDFDPKRAKIEAIANLFNLKVTWASKTIRLKTEKGAKKPKRQDLKKMAEVMSSLKKGPYIVRNLEKDKSRTKQEVSGHTLFLVKKGDNNYYFFEPNGGLYKIKGEKKEVNKYLFDFFNDQKNSFDINDIRFYKVDKQVTPPSKQP